MKQKGITLISLIVTIVIITIISAISIGVSSNLINKAKLESLKTNMLLIKTKGKEYVEKANFKLGTNIDTAEDKTERITNAKLELKGNEVDDKAQTKEEIGESAEDSDYAFYYNLSEENLEEMGIKGIKLEENEEFIIRYEIKDMSIEVYNTLGFNGKYSLTEIDQIEE